MSREPLPTKHSSSLRVLLSHRYFWPDTPPYASFLASIAKVLHGAGIAVEVFSSRPSYRAFADVPIDERPNMAGLPVTRIRIFPEKTHVALRLVNALWYCIRLFGAIIWRQPDVVQAASFPPVVAAWTAGLASRLIGAGFIYHIQDIHPELSVYSGGPMGRSPWRQLFAWLDKQSLHRASAVVVLSEDMRTTLAARGCATDRVSIINNFLPETHGEHSTRIAPPSDGELILAFAGNLGSFQGLDAVIDAAWQTRDLPDLHYWFIGSGDERDRLINRAGELVGHTIHFVPRRPLAVAIQLIRQADIGLAPLAPNIFRVAYPSKVLTYLGLGKPVLACVEPESELARLLVQEDIGAAARPNDPQAIATAFRYCWNRRKEIPAMTKRVERLAEARFARERILGEWVKLYQELMKSH